MPSRTSFRRGCLILRHNTRKRLHVLGARNILTAVRSALSTIWILLFASAISAFAAQEVDLPAEAKKAEQEFNRHGFDLRQATNDTQRAEIADRVRDLSLRLLKVAETRPKDPDVVSIYIAVLNHEMWVQNNTTLPGWGELSRERQVIEKLIRDHVTSPKAGEVCWRMSFGFRPESEPYFHKVIEQHADHNVKARAAVGLGQYLKTRLNRLDLLRENPEMKARYEELFGAEKVSQLLEVPRATLVQEMDHAFERVVREFPETPLPFGGPAGLQAAAELYESRSLSPGNIAPELVGVDQEGKATSLADLKGRAVLVYFWSEY